MAENEDTLLPGVKDDAEAAAIDNAKPLSEVAKREEEILAYWNEQHTFEQSLNKPSPQGDFTFYDGPPFATGLPHHGHILAGTIKDAIPRYKTMRGYHVRRRWGWDCHGLPLENIIEKELGIKTKRDIEEMGVGAFNEAARNAVLRYVDEWKRIVPRIGRWVDMEDDYKTMDTTYTESVWWAFKKLFDDGHVYEGFKAMQYCPRCGTTLSNFEVTQGYKDIEDLSVTAKFELVEHPSTYFLAWTTTPWTLPGNVALAVGPEIEYSKVKADDGIYILASAQVETAFKDLSHEVLETMPGSALVGISYKPVFSGVLDTLAQGPERDKLGAAFKVYAADFVETGEGTGIVHVSPAYGEEDLGLANQHGLPVVHHVDRDGRISAAVPAAGGKLAKPKGQWWETDTLIVDYLKKEGHVFSTLKYTHSYPHCWRCDTPLLNYASSSWFVSVSKQREKLVSINDKISWVPEAIGKNRFGEWLANARDWAVSRTRYWGAPIPVWKNEATGAIRTFGSIEDVLKHGKRSGNTYFMMRHGEAESNVLHIASGKKENEHHLTQHGRTTVFEGAHGLLQEKVDFIFVSPFVRTRETAEIVRDTIGLDPSNVIVDERLSEINFGSYEGRAIPEYLKDYPLEARMQGKAPEGGETIAQVRARIGEFLYELEAKYADKTILIVSHGDSLWQLRTVAEGATPEEAVAQCERDYPLNAVLYELGFKPLPHNQMFELDLHRPYIDEYEMVDTDGAALHRVVDVFDCWFESGSMPYAQDHYPFEKENFNPEGGLFKKHKGFPANFIAEGLDQTRGWFYSMLVLGVTLFGKSPYENVIVNGLILAEDGRKMSKSLKNFPEPMDIVEQYGADALRLYLLSSPLLRGEDLRFSERGVAETGTKVLGRLHNMLVFLETYATAERSAKKSDHLLDRWVTARLAEIGKEVTDGLESYELDRATRPLGALVDDLSTWYLRRSRERVKDSAEAASTLRDVLRTSALLFAPFAPFYAEHLWQKVRAESDPESVHLADWPTFAEPDHELLKEMAIVRSSASDALKLRQEAGMKVRQPLAKLTIDGTGAKNGTLASEFAAILAEEVNVKEVISGSALSLDTELTPELITEGDVREFMRALADARKDMNLEPKDLVRVTVEIAAESTLSGLILPGLSDLSFASPEDAQYSVELSFAKIAFSVARDAA